ncbi:MAG TPA: glycosyltransferase family 4 protein [Myxococcales bacterium]|jgi:glycosyltransferase involved in cell wall biosynthesis
MWELAETLRRHGHEVTVLTSTHGDPSGGRSLRDRLVQREEREGVRIVRVPTLPIHRSHAPAVVRGLGQLVNALVYLEAALLLRGVDVTLAYSPPLPLALVGLALQRIHGVPHVLNVQDLVPQYAVDLGVLRSRAAITAARWVERFLYRQVKAISVHSRGNADYLKEVGVPPAKVAIVPNWVDTSLIRPRSRRTQYRTAADLDGKFAALFAGMLGFAQDLDTVVEAGSYLRDHPDIVLLIVGDGVEKARLQEKVRQLGLRNVRFMPFVSKEAYPEVVASADVCLATLQKSLLCPVVPSKLLGYMAAGRPVIASFPEGGDAPRLVREAGCGICVPAGDPARLARAIYSAYTHPDECRRWGERGRRFVRDHHDREGCVALYEALFSELTGQPPRAATGARGHGRARRSAPAARHAARGVPRPAPCARPLR